MKKCALLLFIASSQLYAGQGSGIGGGVSKPALELVTERESLAFQSEKLGPYVLLKGTDFQTLMYNLDKSELRVDGASALITELGDNHIQVETQAGNVLIVPVE